MKSFYWPSLFRLPILKRQQENVNTQSIELILDIILLKKYQIDRLTYIGLILLHEFLNFYEQHQRLNGSAYAAVM